MPRELACRKCLAVTQGRVCPVCGSDDLSENWKGLVIMFEPEGSDVASTLNLKKPGRYALQVS
ncbi:MAG: DNA-directed RNA polymerase, subunit E'' [Nitrososphaerota archaeon]|nr:DNA-directed RNA polymerase, subunit E'' [Nitrososphaerota archaeon]